jgi:hypothetical protein
MALIEDALAGWGGGFLVGLGAALVGPSVLPTAGSILRPVVKTLVRGALVVAGGVQELAADASEQVSDLVAEVRAQSSPEQQAARAPKRRTAASQHAASRH